MKKLLTIGLLAISYAYATNNAIDLNTSDYTCNGKKITYGMTENEVKNICRNYKVRFDRKVMNEQIETDEYENSNSKMVQTQTKNINSTNEARARFSTDNGTILECFYKDKVLYKCKTKTSNTKTKN